MRCFLWAVVILCTFILQERTSLFNVTLNLTCVLAYYAGIRKGEMTGLLVGSLVGIIEDSLSGTFLGPHLLSKGLVGFFSSTMSGSVFRWTPFLGVVGISVFTFLDSTVVFISRSLFEKMPMDISPALFIFIIQILANALLGLAIKPEDAEPSTHQFNPLNRIERIMKIKETR
jgi:rod shape-determining protein MreD